MLTTNLDVEARFANGTQGRLLCWHPCGEQGEKRRKVVPASHPDLSCRFLKETSKNKSSLLADVDHIDATLVAAPDRFDRSGRSGSGSVDRRSVPIVGPAETKDVTARPESMSTVPGCPVMLQLGTVPAYALTARGSVLALLPPACAGC